MPHDWALGHCTSLYHATVVDGPGEVTFEPKPTDQEINFILSECNRVLRDKVTRETVRRCSLAFDLFCLVLCCFPRV